MALLRTLFVSHSCTPSFQNEAEVRKTAARFSSSCSSSVFGTGPPSYATYHLFPSTTSSMINIKSPACVVLGGSMHTYMCSAPTRVNFMLNSFGHLIGSPNKNRLRTFHHNLRHGCQTKLTSLHKNKVEPTVLAAVCQIHKIPLVQTCVLVIQLYVRTYTWDIFSDTLPDILPDISFNILFDISFHILSDISFHILSDISSDILSDIFLTYLLTFFLTYLLTFFLTYLLT